MLRQLKRVFKDSVIYGLGSLLPKAAGFLLVPVYTRFMSPSDYGILSMTSIIASAMSSIFMLGQNGSVTRFFRTKGGEADAEALRRMLFTVTIFTIAFGALLLAVSYAVGPALFGLAVKDPAFTFIPYVWVAILGAYFAGPMLIWQAVARAQRRSARYVTVQVSNFSVNTIASLVLVVGLGLGALGSLYGTLVAAIVYAPLSIWFMRKDLSPHFSTSWLKRSLVFGLPLVPHYFAGWLLSFADRYILERYTSLAQVGIYSLAYNVAMVASFVAMSVNQAWTPIYYDMADSSDAEILPRLTTLYAAGIMLFCGAFLLVSRGLLIALSAPKYHSAASIVPIVVAAYAMQAMYFVTSTTIFYERKTQIVPLVTAGAAFVNIALNLWLIPIYGIYAAAWTTFGAFSIMAVTSWSISRGLRPGIFEDGKLLRVLLVFGFAWLSDAIIALAAPPLSWESVALRLLAIVLLPVGLVVSNVIAPAEVRSLVTRVRSRRIRVTAEAEDAVETQAFDADGQSPDDTRIG